MSSIIDKIIGNIEKTPESIRAAAERLIASGNSTLRGWGQTTLQQLESALARGGVGQSFDQKGDDLYIRDLDKAFLWAEGSAQPSKRKKAEADLREDAKKLQAKIDNEASNIANLLDFPDGMSEKEKEVQRAKVAEKESKIAEIMNRSGDLFGLKSGQVEKDSSGNFVPVSFGADAGVPGVPIPTGTTAPSIPFRDGLSDAQKQSITDLVASRPPHQWTDNDKANWAFATSSAPVPTTVETGAASVPSSLETTVTAPSRDRQFYRVGGDIYDASTGRQLGPTEWERDWSGKATEVQAPEEAGKVAPSEDTTAIALPQDIESLISTFPPEQQDILRLAYDSLVSGDEARKADVQKALDDAIGLADPFFREQIRLVQDELSRSLVSTKEEAASQIGQLQTRINQLNEDLTFNREQLTLEEQAALAQQLRQNKSDLQNLQTQFAEAGLAFSSPRQEAEKELAASQMEVAEARRRQTGRSLRELETGTLRSIQDAAAQIADVTRRGGEQTIAAVRRGESVLGSEGLPEGTGVTPLGSITGSIAEQRQAAILGLEQTLLQRTEPVDVI